MQQTRFSLEDVKRMDMVQYLEKLGLYPARIHRQDHWYCSPFRIEKEPSFKVNRQLNAWFDFGEGKGGNLVDFAIRFHQCSLKDLLKRFATPEKGLLGYELNKKNTTQASPTIEIIETLKIAHPALLTYLHSRRIPADVARTFCEEIHYQLNNKNYFAIGFKNDLRGYELRSRYFKGSSSPKSVRFLDNNRKTITVFEGFFSFLSYRASTPHDNQDLTNYLVLNSLSFFEKSRAIMERHETILLYLDRDKAGSSYTQKALEWSPRYQDASRFYDGYKDLNHWLQESGSPKQQMRG